MDRFIHLTNNSVAKYAEGSKVSHEIQGNMWSLEEMQTYLQEENGWDVYEDKLKDQVKNIVINCLESVQDMFECIKKKKKKKKKTKQSFGLYLLCVG